MPGWLADRPFALVYVVFAVGAFLRSQGTYWLGRGVAAGVLRSRWAGRVDSDRTRRATAAIERWGMPVVPLSFLTVGFQTAVNAGAGLLRLRWARYTLWALPGCLVWALVWAGGGMAAAAGTAALAARSPWAPWAVLAALAGGAAAVVAVRRRRVRAVAPPS